MADSKDNDVLQSVIAGDDRAFERIYDRYQQKARLMAWSLCRRNDWIDDLVSEAWCRAFRNRKNYNPDIPFAVWLAGILRNVYLEHCRKSPLTTDQQKEGEAGLESNPEEVVAQAEALIGLNDCIARLSPQDARIVQLRFFDNQPLSVVAQSVKISESTLRVSRIPLIMDTLRGCLAKKGLKFFSIFSAPDPGETQ